MTSYMTCLGSSRKATRAKSSDSTVVGDSRFPLPIGTLPKTEVIRFMVYGGSTDTEMFDAFIENALALLWQVARTKICLDYGQCICPPLIEDTADVRRCRSSSEIYYIPYSPDLSPEPIVVLCLPSLPARYIKLRVAILINQFRGQPPSPKSQHKPARIAAFRSCFLLYSTPRLRHLAALVW